MRYMLSTVALAAIGLGTVGTAAISGQDRSPVRTIKDGVLDAITLYVDRPPASAQSRSPSVTGRLGSAAAH
jgi:hypothetical protein